MRRSYTRINKSFLNLATEDLDESTNPVDENATPDAPVSADPVEAAKPDVVITTATAVVPSSTTDAPVADPSTAAPAESGLDAPVATGTDTQVDPAAAVEPETAPAADPVVETPAEPVSDPVAEPAAEPSAEPASTEETPTPEATPEADPVADPAAAPDEGGEDTPASPETPAEDLTTETPQAEPAIAPETPAEPSAEVPSGDVPPPAAEEPAAPVGDGAADLGQAAETTGSATADATNAAASAAAASLAGANLAPDSKVIVVVVEPAVSQDDQDEMSDMGDDVDGEIEEADGFALEAEEVIEEIVVISEASDELQELAEVAEDAAETGGLSDDGAKLLTVATEAIYARFGMRGHNGVPSLESFQGQHSRVGSTQIAVEDIKDKIKAFGTTIVNGLAKVWEFIKGFFAQILTASGRLEARARKVQELAKSFKGNGSAQLENPGVAQRLVVGSAVPTNLAAGLSVLNDFVADATSGQRSAVIVNIAQAIKKFQAESTIENMSEMQSIFDKEQLNTMTQALNLKALSEGNSGRAHDAGAPEAPENTTLKASPTFPGNVIIWVHVPQNDDGLAGFGIGRAQSDVGKDAKTLPNLKGEEIVKIAEQALRFVQLKAQFDKAFKDTELAFKVVRNAATQIATSTQANNDGVEKGFMGFVGVLNKAIRNFNKLGNGVHRYAITEGLRTHNAALDYAQLALSSATKKGTAQAQLAPPKAA